MNLGALRTIQQSLVEKDGLGCNTFLGIDHAMVILPAGGFQRGKTSQDIAILLARIFPVFTDRSPVVAQTFDRITQPHGYTLEGMHAITVPTLVLTGDRDPFCPVEEGAAACRALPAGELAVLPTTGHLITPAAVQTTIEFFERL